MGISSLFSFNLNQTSSQYSDLLNQLSSFQNPLSEDPSDMELSNSLESEYNGLGIANASLVESNSALSVASGGLNQIQNSLQQLQSIATESASGTLTDSQRSGLQDQFDQVVGNINQIAQTTNFNGQNLLNGSFSQSLQTGPNQGDTSSISIGSVSASALGISAAGVSTQSAAQDALGQIQSAMQQVNSISANVGATQDSLQYTQEANSIASENIAAAQSQTQDADIGSVTSQLHQNKIQQQAQIKAIKVQNQTQKSYESELLSTLNNPNTSSGNGNSSS